MNDKQINLHAIVTGGSRGIGSGIVKALCLAGYDVFFSYNKDKNDAELLCSSIKANNPNIRVAAYKVDLSQPEAYKAFFNAAVSYLGVINLLVNNAGITKMQTLQDLSETVLDNMLMLDFRSYILLMKEAANKMLETKTEGSIINITSSRGERAYPGDGIYGGLKAALNRAIESFAIDLAPYGIRINNVAPGAIQVRTKEQIIKEKLDIPPDFWDSLGKRIPLRRVGTPEDIAKAVLFLASTNSSYITGITLRVDGGLILPGMPEGQEPIHNIKQDEIRK